MHSISIKPRMLCVAVVLAMAMSACGGDSPATDDPPGDSVSRPSVGTVSEPDAGGDGGGGGPFGCPLSAKQVGEVLGVAVDKDDAACSYSPSDGSSSPFVLFISLTPEACAEEWATGNGYVEWANTFDVNAYLRTDGASKAGLLVCSDAPFEVAVDAVGGEEFSTTAAERLAAIALEAG